MKNNNIIHIIMPCVIVMTLVFARMQVVTIDLYPVCGFDQLFDPTVAVASPVCKDAIEKIQYNCIFLVICEVIAWIILAVVKSQKKQVQEI